MARLKEEIDNDGSDGTPREHSLRNDGAEYRVPFSCIRPHTWIDAQQAAQHSLEQESVRLTTAALSVFPFSPHTGSIAATHPTRALEGGIREVVSGAQ